MRWGFVVMCALWGFGCSGPFNDLPQHEQERWQRCAEQIRRSQCVGSNQLVYGSICLRGIADNYASRSTERARSLYLVEQGCPRDMVGYGGSSGGDVAEAPRPVAPAPEPPAALPPTGRAPDRTLIAEGAGWWCFPLTRTAGSCARTHEACDRLRGARMDMGENPPACTTSTKAHCHTQSRHGSEPFASCWFNAQQCEDSRRFSVEENRRLGSLVNRDISDCARFE
jgi:hypothetical protein